MKRVFVLGSGFSASMGLPTLRQLFPALMERPNRPGESDREEVLYALEILYPHFQPGISPPAFPPFEEFLSLVDAARDFPFFQPGYWSDKNRSALRLLTDCLAELSEGSEGGQLLHSFTDALEYGDVVITFNWDNLIERALQSQQKAVNLTLRDSQAITLLKLHGSLNWVKIPEGMKLKDPSAVVEVSGDVVRTPDFRYYDVWDVLDQPPLIIPPIASKRALSQGLFRNIWHEALASIAEAAQLTFIGYSIPRDDLQARGFLTVSLATRPEGRDASSYTLIDPDPAVCGRYVSVIGGSVQFHQARFSENHIDRLFGIQ